MLSRIGLQFGQRIWARVCAHAHSLVRQVTDPEVFLKPGLRSETFIDQHLDFSAAVQSTAIAGGIVCHRIQ